jgi:hypothetical protein
MHLFLRMAPPQTITTIQWVVVAQPIFELPFLGQAERSSRVFPPHIRFQANITVNIYRWASYYQKVTSVDLVC